MNIESAFSTIGSQITKLARGGHDARVVDIQVDPVDDYPGRPVKEIMVIVSTRGGALCAASFADAEPLTPARRRMFEFGFITVAAIAGAVAECDHAG